MICARCGRESPEESRLCLHCGAALAGAAEGVEEAGIARKVGVARLIGLLLPGVSIPYVLVRLSGALTRHVDARAGAGVGGPQGRASQAALRACRGASRRPARTAMLIWMALLAAAAAYLLLTPLLVPGPAGYGAKLGNILACSSTRWYVHKPSAEEFDRLQDVANLGAEYERLPLDAQSLAYLPDLSLSIFEYEGKLHSAWPWHWEGVWPGYSRQYGLRRRPGGKACRARISRLECIARGSGEVGGAFWGVFVGLFGLISISMWLDLLLRFGRHRKIEVLAAAYRRGQPALCDEWTAQVRSSNRRWTLGLLLGLAGSLLLPLPVAWIMVGGIDMGFGYVLAAWLMMDLMVLGLFAWVLPVLLCWQVRAHLRWERSSGVAAALSGAPVEGGEAPADAAEWAQRIASQKVHPTPGFAAAARVRWWSLVCFGFGAAPGLVALVRALSRHVAHRHGAAADACERLGTPEGASLANLLRRAVPRRAVRRAAGAWAALLVTLLAYVLVAPLLVPGPVAYSPKIANVLSGSWTRWREYPSSRAEYEARKRTPWLDIVRYEAAPLGARSRKGLAPVHLQHGAGWAYRAPHPLPYEGAWSGRADGFYAPPWKAQVKRGGPYYVRVREVQSATNLAAHLGAGFYMGLVGAYAAMAGVMFVWLLRRYVRHRRVEALAAAYLRGDAAAAAPLAARLQGSGGSRLAGVGLSAACVVLSPLLVLVAAFLPLIFASFFLSHAVADALAGDCVDTGAPDG